MGRESTFHVTEEPEFVSWRTYLKAVCCNLTSADVETWGALRLKGQLIRVI